MTVTAGRATFTAPDGAVAECHPPFAESLPPLPASAAPGEIAAALAGHAALPRTVGVLLVRLGGYAAGVFTGSPPVLADAKVGSRPVHGRSAAGGWSQQRFARRREKQANEALQAAADAAAAVFGRWPAEITARGGHAVRADGGMDGQGASRVRSGKKITAAQLRSGPAATARRPQPAATGLAAVVLGGDKRAVDGLRADPRLARYFALATERFLTVPDPRRAVLESAPRLFTAIRIWLTEPAAEPGARALTGRGAGRGPVSWGIMIVASGIELRAGARLLLADASFQIAEGDRIGLVGRNGAGKTTLAKVLSGAAQPAAGTVRHTGTVGYLPQDPRTGDLDVLALDRILSARGLDELLGEMRKAEALMSHPDKATAEKAIRRYGNLSDRLAVLGGYAAEAQAAAMAASLGLPDRVLRQPLHTLSGGQRRRIELTRILFSDAQALLLDEPTNHLDADSVAWLRDHLKNYRGGLLVISHDVDLVEQVVNKVFYLDANRSALDIYNVGWKTYLTQREADERRRRRERVNAERQASALQQQAAKLGAKATKARAAQNMQRRADRLLAGLEAERRSDRVARLRFPEPAPSGKTPLTASGLSKSYGSLEVFTDVDLAVDRGSRVVVLGLNGAGKTTLLRLLAGVEEPDTGEIIPGHGLRLGYYAQEHETLDTERSVMANMRTAAPELTDTEQRKILGSFLFSQDDVEKPVGVLSGGEKTRLALALLVVSGANVLLLDEPTNNLDPASREEILAALAAYRGAIVLVTHDEGAVDALAPQRVIVLPEGTEDIWSADFADLVALA